MRQRRQQPGIILMDLAIAFVVLAALTFVLVQAVTTQRKASVRLTEQRTIIANAERVLAALLSGGKTPAIDARTKVTLRILADEAGDRQAWVEIVAASDRVTTSLIGIADRAAAEAFIKEAAR